MRPPVRDSFAAMGAGCRSTGSCKPFGGWFGAVPACASQQSVWSRAQGRACKCTRGPCAGCRCCDLSAGGWQTFCLTGLRFLWCSFVGGPRTHTAHATRPQSTLRPCVLISVCPRRLARAIGRPPPRNARAASSCTPTPGINRDRSGHSSAPSQLDGTPLSRPIGRAHTKLVLQSEMLLQLVRAHVRLPRVSTLLSSHLPSFHHALSFHHLSFSVTTSPVTLRFATNNWALELHPLLSLSSSQQPHPKGRR